MPSPQDIAVLLLLVVVVVLRLAYNRWAKKNLSPPYVWDEEAFYMLKKDDKKE